MRQHGCLAQNADRRHLSCDAPNRLLQCLICAISSDECVRLEVGDPPWYWECSYNCDRIHRVYGSLPVNPFMYVPIVIQSNNGWCWLSASYRGDIPTFATRHTEWTWHTSGTGHWEESQWQRWTFKEAMLNLYLAHHSSTPDDKYLSVRMWLIGDRWVRNILGRWTYTDSTHATWGPGFYADVNRTTYPLGLPYAGTPSGLFDGLRNSVWRYYTSTYRALCDTIGTSTGMVI